MSNKLLYDGKHPNKELSNKWYTFMCHSILKDILKLENDIDSQSSDEEDSWDFKRAHTICE